MKTGGINVRLLREMPIISVHIKFSGDFPEHSFGDLLGS